MRIPAVVSVLIGLAILVTLVVMNGAAGIEAGIAAAGWGIVAVILMHLPQVLFSAQAWRAVIAAPRLPSIAALCGMRLIREAVNGLLPVAQIGGHIVGARLLARSGVPLSAAGASVAVDLTLEMLAQVGFTLLGVGLLMARPGTAALPHLAPAAFVGGLAFLLLVFVVAQRLGLFRVLEGGLLRLARRLDWKGLEDVSGLHLAVVALYRSPRRLMAGAGYHFVSWLLGGFEVLVAMHVLSIAGGPREAMIIESLGQVSRAMGFAVPGGLGVQEGGIILICGLLGIGPQQAIELALLKRLRELAIGVPGLLVWYGIEGRRAAADPLKEISKKLSQETIS
jgi:putative membrane protein